MAQALGMAHEGQTVPLWGHSVHHSTRGCPWVQGGQDLGRIWVSSVLEGWKWGSQERPLRR